MAPRKGKQLGCQLGGTVDRVRDGIDIALSPFRGQIGPLQQIDGGADHGEQIVEIMRDAAGQLSQRLQPLAVLERFFGFHPARRLGVQMLRSPQRHCQQQKQQCGRRHAENQMLAHGGEPACANRRSFQSGADINRIFREPLIADAAFDAVGRRGHGDEAAARV